MASDAPLWSWWRDLWSLPGAAAPHTMLHPHLIISIHTQLHVYKLLSILLYKILYLHLYFYQGLIFICILHKKIKNCHKALAVIISLTILCHQIYTIQLVYYCSTTHTSSNHHKSCQVFWISLCHLLCSFLRGQKGFIGSDLDLSICHTYVILGYTVQPRIVLNVSCNTWNTISKVSLKNWTGNFSLCK